MADVCWSSFILLLGVIHCYENLSLRPTTTLSQSSTYTIRYASFANDGNLRTKEMYCAQTAVGHIKAWFQVDLGEKYNIKSVKIYYRKEGDGPGDWKQYRFRHFYLDVSNSPAAGTDTTQRIRCYTDNSTGIDLPPNIIDLSCKQTTRYIIVETTYDAPEDNPTTGAILEICEIEVYGCELGKYGDVCQNCRGCETCDVITGVCMSVSCSVNCVSGACDSTTGYCTQGCSNGYWGSACTSTCPPNCHGGGCDINGNCNGCRNNNYWGQTCSNPCPQYCNGGACDQNIGYCSNGCTQGRYGNICEHTCNVNCLWNTCVQNSGVCTNGCDDYYYGYKCEYQCSSHCSPRRCDRYNGTCTGCSDGYHGLSCRNACSVNCAEGTCDQQTGRCDRGCQANWDGDQCDKCTPDFYGELCDERCSSHCVNGTCFLNNGTRVGGCTGRFIDDKCTQDYQQFSTKTCDNTMAIVSIVLSVIIVLTGSIINVLWWRRNQTLNTKKGIKENVDSQIRAHDLTEIPNSGNPYENPVRSDYAELGDLDKPNAYEELHNYTEAVKNI